MYPDVLLDRIRRETMDVMRQDFLQDIPNYFLRKFETNLNYNIVCSVVMLPLMNNGIQKYCIDNHVESASSGVLKFIPTQWNSSLTLKMDVLKKYESSKNECDSVSNDQCVLWPRKQLKD